MTSKGDELLRDPLFQLNAVLWLAQPLPPSGDVVPVFYQQGFRVYALSLALSPPPDARLEAQERGIEISESARPDVVLWHEGKRKFAFVECKASSFSPSSTTSLQARTLLMVSGARAADVLGLRADQVKASLLVWVVPRTETAALSPTLDVLCAELAANKLSPGLSSLIGLARQGSKVWALVDESAKGFFDLSSSKQAFLKLPAKTDPRPLYFIPYDPDISQSPQEQVMARRILFERIQSSVIAAVGRAIPPGVLVLKAEALLNDAMFGAYGLWQNQASRKHMKRLCRDLMQALAQGVNSRVEQGFAFEFGEGWKLDIGDEGAKETILDCLTRFSCETMKVEEERTGFLFEETGD